MRIYELSKQLSVPSKEILAFLKAEGIAAKSHMSALDDQAVAKVRNKFEKKAAKKETPAKPKKVVQDAKEPMQKESIKSRPSVVQKKSKPVLKKSPTLPSKKVEEPVVATTPDKVVIQPMIVSDAAIALGKPVNDIILTLLKWRIIAAKNKVLPEEVVERLARHYEIEPVKKEVAVREDVGRLQKEGEGALQDRLPVVVVLGHVDHGKTTLLDFIRKTRVVAKEKGGITQHLGAYEAKTDHGNLVFLDTPGHEAFPKMRQRGVRVADVGVLVIAADDGIMPQTLEALKQLKKMEVPIIVAINKIDKVDPSRVEVVKRQLAEQDLLPEEWGGQTVCIPISALEGKGVDQLLEMIALQAQLLELRASQEGQARCFVLESRLVKGRGPVATLICQHGKLKIGDYFVCGNTQGRVSSILNSAGEKVLEGLPSIPIQVAGFKELPDAGDFFKAVSKEEQKRERQLEQRKPISMRGLDDKTINLLVKADTNSSKEALVDAIHTISGKSEVGFSIVHVGIGDVSESDVELAYSTNTLIVGLHVKAESNAIALATQRGVTIELFGVIYKLLEMLQERAEKEKTIEMVKVKTGEAIVRRVFDIKGVGVVAGSYVQDGRFVRTGFVVGWRGREKLGEGAITSLQREKKNVKEVHTGFECGFVVEGITDWQEGDRAECFIEEPKK